MVLIIFQEPYIAEPGNSTVNPISTTSTTTTTEDTTSFTIPPIYIYDECRYPEWQGDGHCDDDNNTFDCEYDGGDCCTDTELLHCKKCECKEPGVTTPKHCEHSYWIQDGHCDDENNVKECDYDGGDCCTDTKQKYCKECKCIQH